MNTKQALAVTFAAAGMMIAGTAGADGSGRIGDAQQGFEYHAPGPFVFPNITPATSSATPVVCEAGTPTCDIYTLTVDFSPAFRDKNPDAFVDVSLAWDTGVIGPGQAVPDFDLYVYDANGALVGTAATAANPEFLPVPLEVLGNGVYQFHVIPFTPMGEGFTLSAEMTGLAPRKSGNLLTGGALGASLLLPLALFGARRRWFR